MKPIKDHAYHDKSDTELYFIIHDAGEAAVAMRDHDTKAECKYLDQVNDASTVLNWRRNDSTRRRHGHAGIFNRHCDQCIENGS